MYFEQMQNIAQCITSRWETSSISLQIGDQDIKFVFPNIPKSDDAGTMQYLQDTTPDIFLWAERVTKEELNAYLERIIRDSDHITAMNATKLQEMLSLGLQPFKVCKAIMVRTRK
jgi:hypothetical protein